MINIKNKKFWFTTVAVLAAPAVLNFTIFQFSTPWTYGDGDEWLSFWGSYSGGLISAYVAYFIANSQIRKQAKIDQTKENYTSYIAQLPALIRIEIELQRYIADIKKLEKERETNIANIGKSGEFDDVNEETKQAFIKLHSQMRKYETKMFNSDTLNLIEKVEDIDLHVQLIHCFQFYEDFSSILEMDIETLEEQKRINAEKIIMNSEGWEIPYLTWEIEKIQDKINDTMKNKEEMWKKFDNENILSKFEGALLKVSNEIQAVKQAKDNPPQI